MKQQFTLNVLPREGTGRSASRRLRKQDRVPAILYGKHTAPTTLSVEGPEFVRLVKAIGEQRRAHRAQRGPRNRRFPFSRRCSVIR